MGAERSDRISRRGALKRIGAGTAIAWSAPVLSSLRTPAYAQYPRVCPSRCLGCNAGDCGTGPTGIPCVCAQTVIGGCDCFQPVCLGAPLCDAADPACPVGFACVIAECCGVSFCAAMCGTPIGADAGQRWA
jgi:hypothetical protein